MQFIHSKDTFAIGNPLSLDKILLSNRHFEYLAFMHNDNHNDNHNMAYFEVLVNGSLRLLGEKLSHLTILKMSMIISLMMGSMKEELTAFIKDKRLRLHRQDDLVRLVEFINRLELNKNESI